MNYFESIILGIIQGLTEFLPVSSSGHLVIFEHLFKIHSENLTFEIFVHFGTLMSVIVVYYSDLKKMIISFFSSIFKKEIKKAYDNDYHFKLSILVIIGTIPAVIAGLLFKDFFISIFHNIKLVGITLIITGLILFLTRFIKKQPIALNEKRSMLIGIAQMFAILPGISRSGFTISAALFSGTSREEAAKFSFLLAVPAILGPLVLELKDLFSVTITGTDIGILLTGTVVSFIVGYIAIHFLLKLLQTGKFSWFSPYCCLVGLGILILM